MYLNRVGVRRTSLKTMTVEFREAKAKHIKVVCFYKMVVISKEFFIKIQL